MAFSVQAPADKITQAIDRIEVIDEPTDTDYVYYYIGAHDQNYGAGGLFMVMIFNNDVAVDYVVEEGIFQDGPYRQVATGTAAAKTLPDPFEITYDADGVFYGLILRVGIKSASAGVYSLQAAAH